jgi:hypothetical protein
MTRSRDTASIIPTVDAKGDLLVGTADNAIDNLPVGTNGTYLKANSASATGLEWATGIESIVDAKGDLLVGTADNTVDNLSPGTNGQVLTANSATTTGLEWTTPASTGNLIINGAMQVAQRGTSSTGITASGYYTADRWRVGLSSQGTWTQSVENDAPTGSGFAKSVKMLCTTADASPAAGDNLSFGMRFEGQNLQSILKGTSSAKKLTISFWVKSNVTNTYIVELQDFDNSRSVSASYSVSASGTWEKKTVTFPADSTGAFDNDNNVSLILTFFLGAGSTFTSGTLATSWESTNNANRAVGQVNLAAATNNYWQITGVQLEAGAVATPYPFQNIQAELAACQRYYYRAGAGDSETFSALSASGYAQSASTAIGNVDFPVTMRTRPTSIEFSAVGFREFSAPVVSVTGLTLGTAQTSTKIGFVFGTFSSTSGIPGFLCKNANANAFLAFSAEL